MSATVQGTKYTETSRSNSVNTFGMVLI